MLNCYVKHFTVSLCHHFAKHFTVLVWQLKEMQNKRNILWNGRLFGETAIISYVKNPCPAA
jgi:hypothetical protein